MMAGRPLNRPTPIGPPQAYKTYAIQTPDSTHFRPVSCEQAGCMNFHYGFRTRVDLGTELGIRQARYIRHRSGRKFSYTEEGDVVTFIFPPGTECFEQHRVRVERPPLLIVQTGDWRRYLGQARLHNNPENWVDDFASHQDKLVRYLQPVGR